MDVLVLGKEANGGASRPASGIVAYGANEEVEDDDEDKEEGVFADASKCVGFGGIPAVASVLLKPGCDAWKS